MFKIILFASALSLSNLCYADTVVFNNFTQTYGYANYGSVIGGPTNGSYFDEFAMSFTPASSGYLSEVLLAFSVLGSSTGDNFNLWLSTDNAGLPNVAETTINFSTASSTETMLGNALIHLNSSNQYFLEENQRYWIGISSTQPGIIGAWWSSTLGKSTTVVERDLVLSPQWLISPSYSSSAFSVSVTSVPAPTAILLFISGLLTLGFKAIKS